VEGQSHILACFPGFPVQSIDFKIFAEEEDFGFCKGTPSTAFLLILSSRRKLNCHILKINFALEIIDSICFD